VGVVPPVLLELPPVVFPFDKPPKKDVVVVVRVLVDELGKPTSPSIEKGRTLRRRVRDTAVEVALGARFQAATKNSVAGRMWTEVQVVFPGSE